MPCNHSVVFITLIYLYIYQYNNVGVIDDCHPILKHCYKPYFTANVTWNSLMSERFLHNKLDVTIKDPQHCVL